MNIHPCIGEAKPLNIIAYRQMSMIGSAKSPREDAFRDIAKPGHIIAPSPRAINALLTLVLSSIFSFS